MKLLDTDTCLAILRGAATDDEVATTWITAGELYYGAAKSNAPEKNRTVVTRFLATLPSLGLGEAKALLEHQGLRLADADLFIGAIAAAKRAAVVTGNRRHYQRILRAPAAEAEDSVV